jgi:uncharacterized repeat protein (TIGR01451 family)
MKRLLLLLVLLQCLTHIKAQYVTIPDANFATWLQANVPSAMNGNQMDTTSLAVTTLTTIDLMYINPSPVILNYTGLQYFKGLITLNINSMYSAQSLPVLPNSIENLKLSGFPSLTNLNSLPNNLKNLMLRLKITTLPTLPNGLESLIIFQDYSFTWPLLPLGLKSLSCSNNMVNAPQYLPALPNGLKELNCTMFSLSNLPTTLPDSLVSLSCGMNSISSIPTLPSNLQILNCEYLQLTSLPALPPFLNRLNCSSNQISCIPTLPNSLNFLNIGNNPFTCLPNYIFAMDQNLLSYPLCVLVDSVNNPNGCDRASGITGSTYYDTNVNCLSDTTDIKLKNISLKLLDNNNNYLNQTSSFSNGIYNFIKGLGIYTVVLDTLNVPYTAQCSNPGIDTLIQLGSGNQNADHVNFSLKCKPGFDVGVQSILSSGIVFPGQTHHLKIAAGDMSQWYNLNCASGVSGQLTINVAGPVTYIAPALGSLTPIVSGTTFTYNIQDFGSVNFLNDFNIILKTDTTATSGDSICVSINVTPTSGDSDIRNNLYNLCYGVVNSYDPNKKEVYPTDVAPGFNDWFTYTIHFQNTGNAPAFNIRLIDTLDTNLDLETFKVINYSHNNTWSINNKVAFFNFQNIQLPDSTSNPEGSKGYIQYKIKPKSNLGAGTKIKNTAYIYFDYNSPIVTNTTINEYTQVVSVKENFKELLTTIYPNPSNGLFTIELSTKEKQNLQLFDMSGNVVLSQTIENGKATIDANYLAAGIYNISIKCNDSVSNKKLVIVK